MARSNPLPAPFATVAGILTASLAAAGTATVSYPRQFSAGVANPAIYGRGNFAYVGGHRLVTQNAVFEYPRDFEITLNTTNITVTWRAATTLAAGTAFTLQLNMQSGAYKVDKESGHATRVIGPGGPGLYAINMGSPVATAANSVCAAQAIAGAANAVINGAVAANGVAYPDVPRAPVMVSSNAGDTAQTVTIFGTDEYGQAMRETRTLNGTTTVAFVKAFASINRVAVSAVMTGNLTVGLGNVLGLPVFIGNAAWFVKEILDAATATAGTTVAGAAVTPTATSADVRGTYVPNSAPDGNRNYVILAWLTDPGDIGGTPFNG